MNKCERVNKSTMKTKVVQSNSSGCYCIVIWRCIVVIPPTSIFMKFMNCSCIMWKIVLSITKMQTNCCHQFIFSSKLYRFQPDIRLPSIEFFLGRVFKIIVGIFLLSTPHRKLNNLCTHPFATVYSWNRHVVTSALVDSIVFMVHVATIHFTAMHVTAIHIITIHVITGHHVIDSLIVFVDVYSVDGNVISVH